jgi:hypothetical protein
VLFGGGGKERPGENLKKGNIEEKNIYIKWKDKINAEC